MAQSRVFVACEDAGVRAADTVVCDGGGARAELAPAGGAAGQRAYCGRAVKGSCRFSGYVLEGVYVDEFVAAEGICVCSYPLSEITDFRVPKPLIGILEADSDMLDICAVQCVIHQVGQSGVGCAGSVRWGPGKLTNGETLGLPE